MSQFIWHRRRHYFIHLAGQLGYFLLVNPSLDKLIWASGFTIVLSLLFYTLLKHLVRKQTQAQQTAETLQTL
ncbi:hypothetical protein A5320_17505 [Rheinheimera sp. SA_1]|uniref:hypothetical protein n=1 Tax=Rheinheimera sp. SA_1 TaxID=1827365 RepID=UPI0008012A7D|nr:hypothetical protein [Rheinheimera sp. SA_1]OBP13716.1 hypothetical protein A5320_17505 [Rheinheimera sp. SA_1]